MALDPQSLPQDEDRFQHVDDLRGGRNGADPPGSLRADECAEAVNVDWNNGSKLVARRRWGADPMDMTGSTMTEPVQSMHRHVPNSDSTQAELWAIDAADIINRFSRGFLQPLGNTFSALVHSGTWVPDATFDPSLVLTVGQHVKIGGNTYTVATVNTSAFTTSELNFIAYANTNVQPESAVWTAPAFVDPMIGQAIATDWSSIDSKLIIANLFAADTFQRIRLHEWDASANSNTGVIRRVGIGPSVSPPAAFNTANGSYANTPRFYRVRWVEKKQLTDWSDALKVQAIPSSQIVLTLGNTHAVTGFVVGPSGNTTLTVSANLNITIAAAAGGGGGAGTSGADGAGGSGGGAGAANTNIAVTLLSTKTYTLHVGAGGAGGNTAGANGDQTFLHNDTDGVYVFQFDGGKGGVHNGAGGNGGLVLVGTGVPGGNGGASGAANTAGSAGTTANGAGGGGGGGGIQVTLAGLAKAGGNGAGPMPEAGQPGSNGAASFVIPGTPGTPGTPNTLQDSSLVNRFGLTFGAGDGHGGGSNWNAFRPDAGGDTQGGVPVTITNGGLSVTFADPWSEANAAFGGVDGNWNAWRTTLNGDGPANPTIIAGTPGTPGTDPVTVPATYPVGGRGGKGGGVVIGSGTFGAGGYGAGGAVFAQNGAPIGGNGGNGVVSLIFTPSSTQASIGGYDATSNTALWTPDGVGDPSEFLLVGDALLIGGNTYTVATVNSTAFTTNEKTSVTYSGIAVEPHASIVIRRSEPSPSVAFTPNGTSNGVSVSHPFAPSDGETHWELEASMDDATYFVIGTFPYTYATYFDQLVASNSNYFDAADGVPSDITGTYNTPMPYKFAAGDQNRLLGFGSWDGTDPQNRVEYSAVRGSLNISDLERVPLGNYLDLDENDSGEPTGLIGPVFGSFFAFKINQFWKLTPTGNSAQPFTTEAISKTVGALPNTIEVGEDEFGNPCLSWMSTHGAYRYIVNAFGEGRLEYIGHPIKDRIDGSTTKIEYDTVSDPSLSGSLFFHHAIYYPALRQVWFYILTDTNGVWTKFVYNIGRTLPDGSGYRSGWSIHGGLSGSGPAACMFSRTPGAVMSRDLTPYMAPSDEDNQILRCDVAGLNTDNGNLYQAYVKSGATSAGVHRNIAINRSYVLANTSQGATFTQSIIGDYGTQITSSTVDLSPVGSETMTRKRFDDSGMADVSMVQFVWGDQEPVDVHWEIAEIAYELIPKEID